MLDHQASLQYTQAVRQELVKKMLDPITQQDPAMIGAIVKLLDGMDRQTLTQLRIQSDEKRSDQDRRAAMILAEINASLSRPNELFLGQGQTPATDPMAAVARLEARQPREGEAELGVIDDSYTAFERRLLADELPE